MTIALVIEIRPEHAATARVVAAHAGDEARLLADLDHRASLGDDIVTALEHAIAAMRTRTASLAPADIATTGRGQS